MVAWPLLSISNWEKRSAIRAMFRDCRGAMPIAGLFSAYFHFCFEGLFSDGLGALGALSPTRAIQDLAARKELSRLGAPVRPLSKMRVFARSADGPNPFSRTGKKFHASSAVNESIGINILHKPVAI